MTLLEFLLLVILWTVAGLWSMNAYARSTLLLHKGLEFVLVILCGPVVWALTVFLLLRKAPKQDDKP